MILKGMTLIELFFNRIDSKYGSKKKDHLVFELNNSLYTGNFVETDEDSNEKICKRIERLSFTEI